jgi:hypothetical protein
MHANRRVILASHLVFTGYAHWFPNDLRGSGSTEVRKDELKPLGEILPGRQFPQPPREDVKRFFREGEQRIEHERIWFREAHRNAIADAFGEAARTRGYTLWACAICSNHAHVVARTHRDRSDVIWHGRIDYVNENPVKEGLPRQYWSFVEECPFDSKS